MDAQWINSAAMSEMRRVADVQLWGRFPTVRFWASKMDSYR
jgi:hypothetical protein